MQQDNTTFLGKGKLGNSERCHQCGKRLKADGCSRCLECLMKARVQQSPCAWPGCTSRSYHLSDYCKAHKGPTVAGSLEKAYHTVQSRSRNFAAARGLRYSFSRSAACPHGTYSPCSRGAPVHLDVVYLVGWPALRCSALPLTCLTCPARCSGTAPAPHREGHHQPLPLAQTRRCQYAAPLRDPQQRSRDGDEGLAGDKESAGVHVRPPTQEGQDPGAWARHGVPSCTLSSIMRMRAACDCVMDAVNKLASVKKMNKHYPRLAPGRALAPGQDASGT